MKQRIVTAVVVMPLVLAVVFAATPAVYGAVVLLVLALSLREYLVLCGIERAVAVAVSGCAATLAVALPLGHGAAAAAGVLPVLALASLWRVEDPERRFRGVAEGFFGLAYIGYALGCVWFLRVSVTNGAGWVFLVLAATWAGDSAAYFTGSRLGRRRLAPTLSPKKTWAGAVGGLLGSAAGGCLALPLLGEAVSPLQAVGVSLTVGIAGQLGDLFESLWKRAKGIKDSGNLFPGHGGILDRIDSLFLGIPVGYHLARLIAP